MTTKALAGAYDETAGKSLPCLAERHEWCKVLCSCFHHERDRWETEAKLRAHRADLAVLPCPLCGLSKDHHEITDQWTTETPAEGLYDPVTYQKLP